LREENINLDKDGNDDNVDDEDRRILDDIIYKKSNFTSHETEIFDLKNSDSFKARQIMGGH
jgi:adenylate cyclase